MSFAEYKMTKETPDLTLYLAQIIQRVGILTAQEKITLSEASDTEKRNLLTKMLLGHIENYAHQAFQFSDINKSINALVVQNLLLGLLTAIRK